MRLHEMMYLCKQGVLQAQCQGTNSCHLSHGLSYRELEIPDGLSRFAKASKTWQRVQIGALTQLTRLHLNNRLSNIAFNLMGLSRLTNLKELALRIRHHPDTAAVSLALQSEQLTAVSLKVFEVALVRAPVLCKRLLFRSLV